MTHSKDVKARRAFFDRRKFSYTVHIPERRSGEDRRNAPATKMKMKVA